MLAERLLERMRGAIGRGKRRLTKEHVNETIMRGRKKNACTFADESGWTLLSDKLHAALVMPEQQQANNQNNCQIYRSPARLVIG
jgi:hypothetical protein